MRISDWSSDVCSSDLGPDPVEVARRMDELAALYAKFQKVYAKSGASAKQAGKLREEMANLFVTFKLPLPLVDVLVRKLRAVLGEIKDHERRILDLATRKAKMPRKDFIRSWEDKQTNLEWVDDVLHHQNKQASGWREGNEQKTGHHTATAPIQNQDPGGIVHKKS